jgi:deferrochelatase/peroxidase EfeB
MPIHLTKPLAWKKADSDELTLLQALQGNILKGHGRESTADIFFKFGPAAKDSKRMLRDLANFHVVSAHRQLLDAEKFKASKKCDGGGPFVHLALSFTGYQALGLAASAPTDTDFRGGMKAADSISALADPAVTAWETPFQSDIHGMVLAADETEGKTAALAAKVKELIEDAGGTIVHVQHGRALKNARGDGIENFGYVDGRSQPLMLQEDIDAETSATGSSRWDPGFPLKLALVDDPGVTDTFSFGSFFVFRKLEQDVRGFKTREQEIADVLELEGEDRELAGAMIVGRFEDGTPVTLSKDARDDDPPNNFNYDGDAGTRCPFHGHIRKTRHSVRRRQTRCASVGAARFRQPGRVHRRRGALVADRWRGPPFHGLQPQDWRPVQIHPANLGQPHAVSAAARQPARHRSGHRPRAQQSGRPKAAQDLGRHSGRLCQQCAVRRFREDERRRVLLFAQPDLPEESLGGRLGACQGAVDQGAVAGVAATVGQATSLATRGLPIGAAALPVLMASMSASLGYWSINQ